eukprot:m51a1_g6384 hypothetical protein (245) ;mRNA; r:186350-187283
MCFDPYVDDEAGRTGRSLQKWLIAVLVLALLAAGFDGWGTFTAGGVLDGLAFALVGAGFFGTIKRNRIALIIYAVGESLLLVAGFLVPIIYIAVFASHIHIKGHSSSSSEENPWSKRDAFAWSSSQPGVDPAAGNAIIDLFIALLGFALILVIVILVVVIAVWGFILGIKIRSVVLAVRMARQLKTRPGVSLAQQESGGFVRYSGVQYTPVPALVTIGASAQQSGYVPPHMQQAAAPGQPQRPN